MIWSTLSTRSCLSVPTLHRVFLFLSTNLATWCFSKINVVKVNHGETLHSYCAHRILVGTESWQHTNNTSWAKIKYHTVCRFWFSEILILNLKAINVFPPNHFHTTNIISRQWVLSKTIFISFITTTWERTANTCDIPIKITHLCIDLPALHSTRPTSGVSRSGACGNTALGYILKAQPTIKGFNGRYKFRHWTKHISIYFSSFHAQFTHPLFDCNKSHHDFFSRTAGCVNMASPYLVLMGPLYAKKMKKR